MCRSLDSGRPISIPRGLIVRLGDVACLSPAVQSLEKTVRMDRTKHPLRSGMAFPVAPPVATMAP